MLNIMQNLMHRSGHTLQSPKISYIICQKCLGKLQSLNTTFINHSGEIR